MIQVFKCDFCDHFNDDASKVQEHEDKCFANPVRKSCFSCKHASIGQHYHKHDCLKDLDVLDAYEDGGCEGWELDGDDDDDAVVFKQGDESFIVLLQSISNPDIDILGYIDSMWFENKFEGEIMKPEWVVKDELEDEFEEQIVDSMFSFYEENGDESNFDTGWTHVYLKRNEDE